MPGVIRNRFVIRQRVEVVMIAFRLIISNGCQSPQPTLNTQNNTQLQITPLPEPRLESQLSLEETLQLRRSIREYSDQQLHLDEISQILWAAQGVTHARGYRTAPSAGALYPLELYIVTEVGVFHYLPHDHALSTVLEGDFRDSLHDAALNQEAILNAPMVLILTAVYERTQVKYGAERSPRYVHFETGHAAQNVLLQAVSLGLGAVPIGAFSDKDVQAVLGLPADHQPLYLIPVGHPD